MRATSAGAEFDGDRELVPTGPPPALRAVIWATVAWGVLTILSNLALLGQRAYLRKELIDSNNRAKHPKSPYTTQAINSDIHTRQLGSLIESLLVVVILILLAVLTSRGRRWARWVLLAMAIVGVPFGVGVLGQLAYGTLTSAPALYKGTTILAGFAALIVVVLLLQRNTRVYFAALRDTQLGRLPSVDGAVPSGPPRPVGGLGALFAPRRRALPPAAPEPAEPPATASSYDRTTDLATPGSDQSGFDEPQPGTTAARRRAPTRPGSVKAKGGGPRPGRSKSRQQ